MRRTPLLLALTLVAAAAAPASAAHHPERPPLRAALSACGTGADQDERFAVFTASMPTARATRRMEMRFDLFERRRSGTRWQRVSAPAFGRWERSASRRAGFAYTKRVERLRENTTYRAVVRFRWFGADGRPQRSARRRTAACRQPDPRPDLVVESIGVLPGEAGGWARYLVTVVNTGLTAAAPFDVGLAGADDAVRPVAGLAAGARTTVEVPGRRCAPGEAIVAVADVRDVVQESDERDNARRTLCDAR